MAETTLVKKLYLKSGYRVAIINNPQDYAYLDLLTELPEGVIVELLNGDEVDGKHGYDLVQVFVPTKANADRLSALAAAALKPGGVLWMSYPKKSGKIKTDIHRDSGWEALIALGWGGVRQISIDETWTALQFKPESDVKRTGSMR